MGSEQSGGREKRKIGVETCHRKTIDISSVEQERHFEVSIGMKWGVDTACIAGDVIGRGQEKLRTEPVSA